MTNLNNLMYLAITTFFYLIVPLLLITWLWSSPSKTTINWLFKVAVTGIYLASSYLAGFLKISGLGHITTYFLFSFFIISIIKSFYTRVRKHQKKEKCSKKYLVRLCYSFLLLFTSASVIEISYALRGSKSPGGEINLKFPLKHGSYYVVQGGSNSLLNHHFNVPGQKFALDIVQINKLGLRTKKLLPSELTDYNIFKTNLYSPTSGTVLKVSNTSEDLQPPKTDKNNPAGNHIILKVENTNKAVLLAHLMKDSIRVKQGDRIEVGQLIGKVGNSGNTSEPHLHIHCVKINDRNDFLFDAESVPMVFDNYFLVRNSVYESK